MKFTCHEVVSGSQVVKYLIRGEGRTYKGSFLDTLKDRVRLEYPAAEFEDSESIPWGQESLGS
jgi:hypothetical protein